MWLSDNGVHTRFLLRDRDAKFSYDFDRLFRGAGTRIIKTPVRAPNANAFSEAWVGSVKREALNHFICFSRGHLDYILQQYADYYNDYRPHQGVGNRTLTFDPEEPSAIEPPPDDDVGRIRCRRFLGGLLRHYYHDAA
jgi:putative transposase